MKKLEIEPIKLGLPFAEELIAAYLNYIGIEYQQMLFLSWGFSLFSSEQQPRIRIDRRIDQDKGDYLSLMEKYFGVILNPIYELSKKELMECIIEEIDNERPVFATCNTLHLPYHPTFGNNELAHPRNVLIVGYSDSDIFVHDPQRGQYSSGINHDQFALSLFKIRVFQHTYVTDDFNLLRAISLIVEKNCRPKNGYSDMYAALKDFADLLENEDISKEMLPSLLRKMIWVTGQRHVMQFVFDYFYRKYNYTKCLEISGMFSECIHNWCVMRARFAKSIESDKKDISNISDSMRKIADHEKIILNKILELKGQLGT